jgi:tRNA dimethylallyltransferase
MINNLVFLLGVTSSGKSDMAISLAQSLINKGYKTIIISSDSRQIYKELDHGSGKINGSWGRSKYYDGNAYHSEGVEHYMIDCVSLNSSYSLYSFIRDYIALIEKIGALDYVIITGGTGLYSRAIDLEYQMTENINNQDYSDYSLLQLQSKLDRNNFNNSDWFNSRRLIAAIKKDNSAKLPTNYPKFNNKFKFIIEVDELVLRDRILNRILDRIDKGMLLEFTRLTNIYPIELLLNLGLEYRYGAYYSLGLLTIDEFVRLLEIQTNRYVKRQLTWNKRDREAIHIKFIEDINLS